MPKKILIIDDDLTLTRLLTVFLRENGYYIAVASDGEEGLGKLVAECPDLILLDVVMPRVNGYAFLFEMRKREIGVNVPVIVLTCKADMADIFQAEGVAEYIIKPFKNKDLLDKVRKYI